MRAAGVRIDPRQADIVDRIDRGDIERGVEPGDGLGRSGDEAVAAFRQAIQRGAERTRLPGGEAAAESIEGGLRHGSD